MHCRISCIIQPVMLAGRVLNTLAFMWFHRKITLPKDLMREGGPVNRNRSFGGGIFCVELPEGQIV